MTAQYFMTLQIITALYYNIINNNCQDHRYFFSSNREYNKIPERRRNVLQKHMRTIVEILHAYRI